MKRYQYVNGREYVLVAVRFLSAPPGLAPLISRYTEQWWYPVAAAPHVFHRPARASR